MNTAGFVHLIFGLATLAIGLAIYSLRKGTRVPRAVSIRRGQLDIPDGRVPGESRDEHADVGGSDRTGRATNLFATSPRS
jgi:hypothetical protein